MSVSPSRRRLLQAALLTPVAAACTGKDRSRPGHVDPDVAIRAAAVARERDLVDRYRAAAASSSPALAAVAAPLLAEHEQHLAALGAPSPQPTASGGSATGAIGGVRPEGVLAAAERSAAAAHAAAAVQASRPLAAVLASLAAAEASHAVLFG